MENDKIDIERKRKKEKYIKDKIENQKEKRIRQLEI